jgi:hypothetical protein
LLCANILALCLVGYLGSTLLRDWWDTLVADLIAMHKVLASCFGCSCRVRLRDWGCLAYWQTMRVG